MRLHYTLGELNENNFDRYGDWRYYVTVMVSRQRPSRLAMLGALNDAQRKQAIVSVSKTVNNDIGRGRSSTTASTARWS